MNSLRARLSAWIALGLAVVLCTATFFAYRTGTRVLTEQFDRGLRTRFAFYLGLVEQEGGHPEHGVSLELAGSPLRLPPPNGAELVQIWKPNGDTLYRSPELVRDFERPPAGDGPEIWDDDLPGVGPVRWIAAKTEIIHVEPWPLSQKPAEPMQVEVVLATDRTELDDARGLLLGGLWGATLGLIVFVGMITWFLVQRGLRPLHKFGDEVRAMDVATLSTPLALDKHPRELAPVATGLNDLRSRVDRALRREKRLAATLAHEFRTPFSELRTLTEVALQDTDDREFMHSALAEVHKISFRLTALLEVIRTLASFDEQQDELPTERIDIEALLGAAHSPLERAIERNGLGLVMAGVGGIAVETNREALESICSNLLLNAVEYSPAGAQIDCRADARADGVVLQFSNPCGNLSADQIPHLTEPFWRGAQSRSDPDRHGLGLNIAKGMAHLAGLGLAFRLEDGRFVAEVEIPTARAS